MKEANRKLREVLVHANDDVGIITAEKIALQNSLRKAQDDLLAREELVGRLESEVERLRQDLVNAKADHGQARAWQEEVEHLQHQLQVSESKLEACELALREAQSEITTLRTNLDTSNVEKKRLTLDNERLRSGIVQHLNTITSLQREVASLKKTLAALELDNDQVKLQLRSAQAEVQAFRTRVKKLQAELDKSKPGDIPHSPSDGHSSDTSSQTDSIPDSDIRHAREIARLRQELEVARALVDRLSAERNAMEARSQKLTEEIARLKRDVSASSKYIQVLLSCFKQGSCSAKRQMMDHCSHTILSGFETNNTNLAVSTCVLCEHKGSGVKMFSFTHH